MLKTLISSKSLNADVILVIFRVGFAFFMIYGHGWPKYERLGADEIKFYNFLGLGAGISLGLAVFAELVCSILLGLGLFSRLACIPLAFTMFVAAFVANADKPLQNKELAILYLLSFLLLFFTGPGKYSLDALLRKR